MFSDPLTANCKWSALTPDTTEDFPFVCTERAADHSKYSLAADADGTSFDLLIAHQYGKRNRFTVRITANGVTPDLLNDGLSSRFSQSVYVVVDTPPSGHVLTTLYPASTPLVRYMAGVIADFLSEAALASTKIERVVAGET